MDDRKNSEAFWRGQKFTQQLNIAGGDAATDLDYGNGLAAYAFWRATDQPLAMRCAALGVALHCLREACTRAPTAGRLSTLARVANEAGARGESVAVLQRLLKTLQGGQLRFAEPFLPASPRFDDVATAGQPGNWFVSAAAEQYETTFSYSSIFAGASPVLGWLCGQPFASSEMERRRVLIAARAG